MQMSNYAFHSRCDHHYEARTVLRGISLDVQPGEVLALIGPNGVGKSTLIHAISGNLKPIGGRILIDGRDLQQLPIAQRARSIAVVPQAVRLPESFTVFDTVLMGRTPYLGWLGREGEQDRSAVWAALDRTCTRELADRPHRRIIGRRTAARDDRARAGAGGPHVAARRTDRASRSEASGRRVEPGLRSGARRRVMRC